MRYFRSTVARVLSLLLALSCAVRAPAAPSFQIIPIGIDDADHTFISPDGYKDITAEQMNAAGHVIGHSRRAFGNGGSSTAPLTAWLYDGTTTINIGLIGPEHTASDGYKYSFVRELNEAGQAIGTSSRHLGRNVDLGHTAWLYHNGSTIDIGLTNAEHTSAGGYKRSFPGQLNEAGQVIGEADRFNGGTANLGTTAWLYDGTNTVNIGLTGAEHTRNNGFKSSAALQLNAAGHVRGRSLRYNANVLFGQTAWVFNGSSTIPIGFYGTGYTGADGRKFSSSEFMSESGKVAGYSLRHTSTSLDNFGQTAWLYDGTNTIEVGLVDAEHTALGDTKFSWARGMNEAGQLTGYSNRYNGGVDDLGYSAWIYNGATSTKIGLTDAEHTSASGVKRGVGYEINEAGQVLGHSERYNGGTIPLGETAWLYNGTSTVRLGLTDAEHTGLNAYKYSLADVLNEAGQVIGQSERYDGAGVAWGQSAWFYNGTTSINIGLTGPNHTRPDGYKHSQALQLNDAGWVIGYSERYAESTLVGQDAWIYHPSLNQTVPLELAATTDGYAYSTAEFLGDDGLVLGFYEPLDESIGSRAFYFTPAGGIHDLGSLVDGGLAANGWEFLATALGANGLGQILGLGLPMTQTSGQKTFLLKPMNQLAGDFNGDGRVDAADYIIWRKTDGTEPGYNAWRANFGRASASGSLSGTHVPEPSAAMLALLAAAMIWIARHVSG